ncbi:Uncharacterised protein [Yersinia rohdei]|uniref:Uncharacterized protein n=1 Tax=Yersinia rohdei TaxID=29485 RepID=A0A0U1HUZ0_YERRO|nr:hypothetical protein [Yersinia rohdei]CQI92588.1 Uncharacterised protein [Yersinia rohdei]
MKETIYIGELILETLPPHSTLTIANSTKTITVITNDTDQNQLMPIDTSLFEAGFYTVVSNAGGKLTITNINIINPMAQTDRLIELQKQLDDLNILIQARISGDTSQLTINNKTLIHESLETLLKLKSTITQQLNHLKKKLYKNNNSGFFKSIIHCRTR